MRKDIFCPLLSADMDYDEDGHSRKVVISKCNHPLHLEVSSTVPLKCLAHEEGEIDLTQHFGDVYWEVVCEGGHKLANGADESGDPLPLSWDMLPGLLRQGGVEQ